MTNSEKLLLFALESCRPEQVDEMLEMARDENVPLTEVAVEVVKSMLDGFNSADRLDATRQFKEMGIDLTEISDERIGTSQSRDRDTAA
jgi:hypothetical protein